MSFTQKEKKQIAEIVQEVLLRNNEKAIYRPTKEKHNVTDEWRKKGIKSDLTGLIVAPEDLVITLSDGNEKKYFTFDEAQEYTENLPDGWRLPTRNEWVLLAEEFGNDSQTGRLDPVRFKDALGLDLSGWTNMDGDLVGVGEEGDYWSSTISAASNGYYLVFDATNMYPANINNRLLGFPVRCVIEDGK